MRFGTKAHGILYIIEEREGERDGEGRRSDNASGSGNGSGRLKKRLEVFTSSSKTVLVIASCSYSSSSVFGFGSDAAWMMMIMTGDDERSIWLYGPIDYHGPWITGWHLQIRGRSGLVRMKLIP